MKSKDERWPICSGDSQGRESSLNYYGNALPCVTKVSGLVVVSSRVDGWPLQLRSITWKQGVWDVSIHGECPQWTDDLSCGCRYYQSRRDQCLQGNLYDVCYEDRWIRTSTYLKTILILWNLGRHRNRWVWSTLRDTKGPDLPTGN